LKLAHERPFSLGRKIKHYCTARTQDTVHTVLVSSDSRIMLSISHSCCCIAEIAVLRNAELRILRRGKTLRISQTYRCKLCVFYRHAIN